MESGPGFARRMLESLRDSRVGLLPRTTALQICEGPRVEVVGPEIGHAFIDTSAIIIATGVRESARGIRMVPGLRPEHGLLTTGLLQQLLARNSTIPYKHTVVFGTEHVAFSAVLSARRAGGSVVAMVEPGDRIASYAAVGACAKYLFRVPIFLNCEICDIAGDGTVEEITLNGPRGQHTLKCDSVLFSGGWVPDSVLAHDSGLSVDPNTRGPIIDQLMRTSLPGVFAAGNVLRGVESAGIAALEGAHAGACAAAHVKGEIGAQIGALEIAASHGIEYLVPQRWDTGTGLRNTVPVLRPSLRVDRDFRESRVVLSAGGERVWSSRRHTLLRHRRVGIRLRTLDEQTGLASPIGVHIE